MSEPVDDPYDILGLGRDASPEEIRRSYKKLAVKYHPDRNSDPQAVEQFKRVAEAYSILNDPQARRRWEEQVSKTVWEVEPERGHDPVSGERFTAQARARPVSRDEIRRRQEFARRYAESMLSGRRHKTRKKSRWSGVAIQKIVSFLVLLYYLMASFSGEGVPWTVPAGTETGFLIVVFWMGVASGLFLIWTPDAGQELSLDRFPAPVLQILGWVLLFGMFPITWMMMAAMV